MRSLALPLLLALAALAAGCDSVEPDAPAGPTVQFAANSLGVSESDGTVGIPVVLSGGVAGQTYTVEVLYASAASETVCGESDPLTKQACFGPDGRQLPQGTPVPADIRGFGAADGPNRVAVATLTGEADTVFVGIDVVEDDLTEAPEAALFVLQSATGGAEVGDTRQFRLEIGTPPIAAVRERALGTTVTVEGVVTRARGRFSYVQDGSGAAIATFDGGGAYFDAIAAGTVSQGDRVQIVGELAEFNGLLQVSNITDFEVLSRGNALPAPQTVTPSQLASSGDALESELVRVTGLTLASGDVVFAANTSYDVSAGGSTVVLRTSREGDTAIVGQPIAARTGGAPGAYGPFTFTGVVGQFRGTNQLAPVALTDVSPN